MKNRRLLIIIFAIFALGIGIVISWKQKDFTTTKITPSPSPRTAAFPPAITLVENAPVNVAFSFVNAPPVFPTTLPVYHVQNFEYQSGELSLIAKSFGFSSAPIKKSVGSSSKSIWSLPSKSLSFYTDGLSQDWSFISKESTPLTGLGVGAPEIASTIKTIFLLPNNLQLVLNNKNTGPFDGVQLDKPTQLPLMGFSFFAVVNKTYPLVSQTFEPSLSTIIVDSLGGVVSLSYSTPPNIIVAGDKPILSVEEALGGLNNNLGVLVFSGRKSGNVFWGDQPSFQSVALSAVSIVYYQSPSTKTLVPFFLFDGLATTPDGVIDVRYAISAIE